MSDGIPVARMSGAGNDFLVLDAAAAAALGTGLARWVRRVCRRGVAVGADGVLLVRRTGTDRVAVDFLNPDGTRAFCGNGSRCAARFAVLRRLAGPSLVLETVAGEVPARVDGTRVRLTLGAPRDLGPLELDCDGRVWRARLVDAGTLHVVHFAESVETAPLERWGPHVRGLPRFAPRGVNVNVARLVGGGQLELRTWEKGVEGETLSCGSGAVAAAFAAWLHGASPRIRIRPRSGADLVVELAGEPTRPDAVSLTGDARLVLEGVVTPEATCGY